MPSLLRFCLLGLLLPVFLACQRPPQVAIHTPESRLRGLLDTMNTFRHSFTGLVLKDAATKATLFELNAEKPFVPASNTKLYTLYASLKTLGDSIPALRYVERNDTLFFWGTADPTLLHPDFPVSKTYGFLRNHPAKTLAFSAANFQNEALGQGWMWDDYNDYYQPELSPLPLYGNIVRVQKQGSQMSISPSFLSLAFIPSETNRAFIKRVWHNNLFELPARVAEQQNYTQDIPYRTSVGLTQDLLKDTLHRHVALVNLPLPHEARTLYSLPVDTVYERMMKESDNMLAEHLLLLCSHQLADTLQTTRAIAGIQPLMRRFMPNDFVWVDGSGVSRYNLFTPHNTANLLEELYATYPRQRLFSLMAIGGQGGTLRSMFTDQPQPYVFAKSGSMGGVYNLSGYLVTRSGRTLVFSFMNNNFTHSVSQTRRAVEQVLKEVAKSF